ncbi:cytochrome P450 [Massariosphaeria phaeospora]|uniref:Cytochrome P450 n=1 Tax=Massariosphaeria phaeospora TaxID=100035 RepID=A0A7C8MCT7_9PLEO|nr:cytochrome P450 [Massariosphaeria phaeospora]
MVHVSALVITFSLSLLYPIAKAIYNVAFHPLSNVPGPSNWAASRIPFIRCLLRGTLVQDVERLHRKYGQVVRIAPDEVTFAHPDAWTEILQPRPGRQQFLKDALWWSEPSPKSLINAIDPATHARIRKTLVPAFTSGALKAQEPIIQRYVSLLIERLRQQVHAAEVADGSTNGAVVDIFPWLNFTTFDVFGDLGFGESFNCLEHSEYHPWIALIFDNIKAIAFVNSVKFYPALDWLLTRCIPASLKKVQADHFQQVVDKVRRRMNWEVTREDLMFHTLKEAKEGQGMSLDEIDYTFAALTIAGSETTATVLGGIVNFLSADGARCRLLSDEVRSAFASEAEITLSRVGGLEYMNGVINEGLRLCPPVPWILPRRVPAGGERVCGVWLAGGTAVSIQQYVLNRDPALFHDASSFVPERWLAGEDSQAASPYASDQRGAVQAFSVGPRSCLGKQLAWAEMRLIVARLVWAFDITAAGRERDGGGGGGALQWEHLRTFLLVEKRAIAVRLRRRQARAGGRAEGGASGSA